MNGEVQLRKNSSALSMNGKAPSTPFDVETIIKDIKSNVNQEWQKRKRLKDLDVIILDNSIRESTVGQLRGHTLENKWKIFDEVERCNFQYKVVAAFSHATRVDDMFIKELIATPDVCVKDLFAFTEAFESVSDQDAIPLGLRQMKIYGLMNPIIEIDTLRHRREMNVDNWCKLLKKRFEWIKKHYGPDAKIFVNFRDFSDAMFHDVAPVLKIALFMGMLPPDLRPFGLMFEEPRGTYMPEEVGKWCGAVRQMMDLAGWDDGHLLCHIHEKWGLAVMAQIECLVNGANGMWASVCEEGAALGHACSTITLMNLIRMGNTKVLERYECDYLRDAAIAVTKITTGREPAPMKPIYGERALDVSFDFGGIAGGQRWSMDAGDDWTEDALAAFFGTEAPMRISTLSSERMIVKRLTNLFGENDLFNEDVASEMKRNMIKDLEENRKEEYMSEPGIAMLFDRSGGKLTKIMADKIAISKSNNVHSELLLKEVRKIWDEWDLQEDDGDQDDEQLKFESFYNGFMAPYFGCHSCEDTRKGLQAIDMDKNGQVDWNEFMVYVKWALNQYPDIGDVDELLAITFKKGLIPAMKDEVLGRQVKKRVTRRQKNVRRTIVNRKKMGNNLTVLPE